MELSAALIIKNEEEYIKECLESIRFIVDEIIIVLDTKTNDNTLNIINSLNEPKIKIYLREWDTGAKQKQYALEQCTKDWILFLDGDEILSDNAFLLKEYIKSKDCDGFSIRSHHFIYHLGLEDATVENHYHHNRLVRKTENLKFKGINHAILQTKKISLINDVRIFHFGYVKHLNKIINKYNLDTKILQIHTQEFLDWWKNSHIFGTYPVKPFNIYNLPLCIKEKFKIPEEIKILKQSQIELKHLISAIKWHNFFKPKKIIDIGAGDGHYLSALAQFPVEIKGCDINPRNQKIQKGNILNLPYKDKEADLIICIDVLEHLKENEIERAVKELERVSSKYILLYITTGDDPNYNFDSTHQTKKSLEWWKKKFSKFKEIKVPKEFIFPPYRNQFLIYKVKK